MAINGLGYGEGSAGGVFVHLARPCPPLLALARHGPVQVGPCHLGAGVGRTPSSGLPAGLRLLPEIPGRCEPSLSPTPRTAPIHRGAGRHPSVLVSDAQPSSRRQTMHQRQPSSWRLQQLQMRASMVSGPFLKVYCFNKPVEAAVGSCLLAGRAGPEFRCPPVPCSPP